MNADTEVSLIYHAKPKKTKKNEKKKKLKIENRQNVVVILESLVLAGTRLVLDL